MASNYLTGTMSPSVNLNTATSAASAYQARQIKPVYTGNGLISANGAVKNFLDKLNPVNDPGLGLDGSSPSSPKKKTSSGSGSGSAPKTVAQPLDYFNAELAARYGMDKATAYQEALANTSYQRAVKDLKEAGLNPVLAMGKVAGADSFTGVPISDGGSSSGGSGAVGRRGSKKSSGVDWKNVSTIVNTVAKVATTAIAVARFL